MDYGDLDKKRLMYFYRWIGNQTPRLGRKDFQSLSIHEALEMYEKEATLKK